MAWENRTAISSPCKYQAYIYFRSDRKEMSNNSSISTQKNGLTDCRAFKETNYKVPI